MMNGIDKRFFALADEIRRLTEKELYYRMRAAFDKVPAATQRSCMAFFNQYPFWGRLDTDHGIYEEIEWKEQALFEHLEDFVWVYRRLADYRSKKTLYAILNNWYCYDFATTTETNEYLFDDYFDLDLVRCTKGEVFVDLGAYVGDTVLSYIENYGEDCYKRIYCYEITPAIFEILQGNLAGYRDIELRLRGIGEAAGHMALASNDASPSANVLATNAGGEIAVTTLDADIDEPITLIKADVEGYEQKALLGARNHILNDHPKLLISVYHNNEDLWRIPQIIHDISSDYTFYLRYKGSPIYPTEITLIAL